MWKISSGKLFLQFLEVCQCDAKTYDRQPTTTTGWVIWHKILWIVRQSQRWESWWRLKGVILPTLTNTGNTVFFLVGNTLCNVQLVLFGGQIHVTKLKLISFMFFGLRNVFSVIWQGNRGPQTPEKRQSLLDDLSDLGEEALGGWDIAVADTAADTAEWKNFKVLEMIVFSCRVRECAFRILRRKMCQWVGQVPDASEVDPQINEWDGAYYFQISWISC